MTDVRYAVPVPAQMAVPILGSDALFPVRRVYCVGRNYAEHIREMGGDERQPPFFFQKPADSVVRDGAKIPYPPITADFQYEVELVLAIGKGGTNIDQAHAGEHVFAQAVGIDLTRRDVQIEARKSGRPWEVGKSFDQSAPLGLLHPLGAQGLITSGDISLTVNGTLQQQGDIAQMIWNSADIVSQLSRQYRLEPGDLIYTGTPAGVGPLQPGDVVTATVAGLTPLTLEIVAPE